MGAGEISGICPRNGAIFDDLEVVACADVLVGRADTAQAPRSGRRHRASGELGVERFVAEVEPGSGSVGVMLAKYAPW